jgi:hypothetical protein
VAKCPSQIFTAMRPPSTSSRKTPLVLASLAVPGCTAAAAILQTDLPAATKLVFALGVGIGVAVVFKRAFFRRTDANVLRPSFETSTLVFPPERGLERSRQPNP